MSSSYLPCKRKGGETMNKELKYVVTEYQLIKLARLVAYLSTAAKSIEMMEIVKNIHDNIISKLPQPVITEADIVEVLKKHSIITRDVVILPDGDVRPVLNNDYYELQADKKELKKIAHEILQDNKWEEVARGKVGYGFNGYTLDEKLLSNLMGKSMLEREGKNIEIAVREIKQK
jgi:hypothetical protein